MASLALGLVGGYLFGPVGYLVGSFLGNLLDPPKVQGPRLSDLKLQASQYGNMIPLQWGSNRIAGTVIWQTDLVEHSHTSGGKGGPQTTTYTYTASFAIGLLDRPAFMGPIANVTRIWADKRLIFDVAGLGTLPCKVYLGDQAQIADPTMEADLGAGNVPGFRDTVYVVFTDYDLSQFYNRIPSFEFEVNTKGATNGAIVGYRLTIDNTLAHQQANPVIASWPAVDVGTVRIDDPTAPQSTPSVIPADVVTYNGTPDLSWVGPGTIGASDQWPQVIDVSRPDGTGFFGEIRYLPAGMLTTTDGEIIPFWINNQGSFSVNSMALGYGPIIVGPDFDTSSLPGYGIDYAAAVWGLPLTEFVGNVIGTQDNNALFIFTGPSSLGNVTKWYKIVNNAIETQGTVSPSIPVTELGTSPRADGASFSSCFEDNGLWCWNIFPGWYGTGHANGAVLLYTIDSTGNFAYYSAGGYCPFDYLNHSATSSTGSASVIAIGTGFCGVRRGNFIGVYTRTVPNSDEVLLSQIVSDVSQLAGLTTGQIDVTQLTDIVPGYTIASQMTARNMIQPLRNAYFFDGVESTGIVKFPKRTNPSVATIPQDDLAAFVSGSTPPPLLQEDRTQDVDLPMRVTVNYLNQGADYQQGSQYSQRQVVHSQNVVALDLPIVLPDISAAAMAVANLTAAWVERTKYTFYTARKYAYLEPTDVVIVQGREMRLITMEEVSTTTIKFEALGTLAQVYQQAGGVSTPATGQPPPAPPSQPLNLSGTSALLLDIPLVIDADSSTSNGFYSAMEPSAIIPTAWPGALLEKSVDGVSYSPIVTQTGQDVFGTTVSILGNFFGGNIFDETNVVTVLVKAPDTLSGASQLAVLNGANAALIGSELIQYKNAVLTAPNQYALSGLLRGRRGTEWAMAGHAIGERFVALPVVRAPLSSEELNLQRDYKAITSGAQLSTAQVQYFLNTGQPLKPYAPVQLAGGVDGSGNVTLTWVRRTRIGGSWISGSDVPLSEPTELYVVQIWNAAYSQCARVITGVTSPTTIYTSAQQVADFGAQQKTIYFTVGQIGSIGIGTQARGTAPGAGASNVNPSVALSPYGSPTYGSPAFPSGAISLVMQWQAGWNSYTSGIAPFPCGVVAQFSFKTGPTAVNGAIGYVSGSEWPIPSASPVIRTACLSTVAGDFSGSVFPNSLVVTTAPTIQFSLGTNPYGFPQLAINTTYYFNVSNTDSNGVCSSPISDCAMRVSLVKPPGT